MVHIYDVADHDELLTALLDGYIREQVHPEFPELRILNYTEKAQFERHWNKTIKATRGLIYNAETFEVLARPFPKIHNWDEPEAPNIAWDQKLYHWGNKFDGSLGILYVRPDGEAALATRGSFASEQAVRGTEMLFDNPVLWLEALSMHEAGYTPQFEIIYPENRIVLAYDEAFLAPLGYIHIESGMYLPYPESVSPERTFGEVVIDLSRPNAEGWVAWSSANTAVKIKQADYVELHRIVTGLNRKSIWRALSEGEDVYADMREVLPDELYKWADEVATELRQAYSDRMVLLDWDYVNVLDLLDDLKQERATDRGDLARIIQENVAKQDWGYMFSLADGRDIQTKLWRELEPKGNDK